MPVFESSRKVLVSGSSLALTLPAMFAKANEIKKGSIVNVFYGFDGVLIAFQDGNERNIEGLIKILEKLKEKANDRPV